MNMIEEISLPVSYIPMEYNNLTIKKVHFVGIGGIGMSALAQMLAHEGLTVTGSDREESPVTELLESLGIKVLIPQVSENVPSDADLIIYSDAVSEGNPERLVATDNSIPQLSYFQALGTVSEGKRTIAVAGTNGKTTTTGMLSRILRDVGAEPTAIIGSIVKDFGSNYLLGTSDLFVVEACEYRRHFLSLTPEVLIVTNIEYDHTDYFRDLTDVQDAFRTLMERVPAHGAIITDTSNPTISSLLLNVTATVIDYAEEEAYDLLLPGEFNRQNARAAASAARFLLTRTHPEGLSEAMRASLAAFHGTWRRFEYRGKSENGADVYDDYAHHPTAITGTLAEIRARTTGKVFVAFHPHLYSRTRDLFEGFTSAFSDADYVFIAPIYAAREKDDGLISSALLAEHITMNGTSAIALETFAEIEDALAAAREGDTVVTMGAGDIYKVAVALVAHTA
jgi:UDP-N-acetylmuramate--alanine ligase